MYVCVCVCPKSPLIDPCNLMISVLLLEPLPVLLRQPCFVFTWQRGWSILSRPQATPSRSSCIATPLVPAGFGSQTPREMEASDCWSPVADCAKMSPKGVNPEEELGAGVPKAVRHRISFGNSCSGVGAQL